MERPDEKDILRLAAAHGLGIGPAEVADYQALLDPLFDGLAEFDQLPEAAPSRARATRDPGGRPSAEANPLNAVIRRCSVRGPDAGGPLAGVRVGVKDSIAIADVPMTCGSELLEGFVPQRDSAVVRKLIEAGAEIVATLNMDAFAISGGAETSSFGPTRNPWDPGRSAAGSSGGSAAALYYDDIDLTLGADQGGSIRLPAAWCGVLGLKPTYGLVPYEGITPVDRTYDHVGPLARSTEMLARGLAAIAEPPPEAASGGAADYIGAVTAAGSDLSELRIGVLAEGFPDPKRTDVPDGTHETAAAVRAAAQRFADLGASVIEVSVPAHNLANLIGWARAPEGNAAVIGAAGTVFHSDWEFTPEFSLALGPALAKSKAKLPPTLKTVLLAGWFLGEKYYGSVYARALNMIPGCRRSYDKVFDVVDVVLAPTATHYAHVLDAASPVREIVARGWSNGGNTPPANVTGHPALSLPAAEADGLPVGVMLTGRHYSEAQLLATAATYERAYGWSPA